MRSCSDLKNALLDLLPFSDSKSYFDPSPCHFWRFTLYLTASVIAWKHEDWINNLFSRFSTSSFHGSPHLRFNFTPGLSLALLMGEHENFLCIFFFLLFGLDELSIMVLVLIFGSFTGEHCFTGEPCMLKVCTSCYLWLVIRELVLRCQVRDGPFFLILNF